MILIDNAIDRFRLTKHDEIVYYILRHTDGDTKIFSRTYNQIQKDLNVSQQTIARTFKYLEDNGTLIRAGRGRWYVPAVVGYEPEDEENDWAILTANKR